MTKTLAPIHPYYMIKAYQWLHDHGAKPETNPTPLASWAQQAKENYDEWRWALVAEDGEVVGEAYPSHYLDSTYYYITLATAQKYGLTEGTLKPAADLALPAIEKQVGNACYGQNRPNFAATSGRANAVYMTRPKPHTASNNRCPGHQVRA